MSEEFLAFPLPGGRWSRRDRMRVSVVGAVVIDGRTQRSAPTGAIVICRRGGPLCPPATAYVPPGSPSSVMAAPCHLLPCGAKAIAVLASEIKALWRSPHPPQCAHWGTFSQEKALKCRY